MTTLWPPIPVLIILFIDSLIFQLAQIISSTYYLAKSQQYSPKNHGLRREVTLIGLLMHLFTLDSNNFREALILLNIVPMSKNSSPCNKFTQSHESPSNLQERSSSDFSFTKTKRSQRKTHKKKITKLVHTVCFFRTDQAGRKEMTYHQHIGETALRSKEGVQRLAKRQNNDHSFKMIELQRKQKGFLERVQKDKEVKIEEQPHVPYAFGYLPQQFYYIC